MDAAEVLERAAGVLTVRGKSTGGAIDECDRPCAIHAIHIAAFYRASLNTAHESIDILQAYLDSFGRNRGISVWSDRSDADTVISTMRACAAIERAKRAQQAAPIAERVTA